MRKMTKQAAGSFQCLDAIEEVQAIGSQVKGIEQSQSTNKQNQQIGPTKSHQDRIMGTTYVPQKNSHELEIQQLQSPSFSLADFNEELAISEATEGQSQTSMSSDDTKLLASPYSLSTIQALR